MADKPKVKHLNGPKQKYRSKDSTDVVDRIIKTINKLESGLQSYNIRILVKDASELGPFLRNQRYPLETNQIRKFLDAINRVKADLIGVDLGPGKQSSKSFDDIEPDIVLLKPKLAYAAARQQAAKPLSSVMSAAIDKVHSLEDFERLVQFIESIIAYHKAAGGR